MTIHQRPVEEITLHDPQDWTVIFGGTGIQGFGPGDAITIGKPTEVIKAVVGAMGEVAVSIARNPLHSVKLNLHQTSAMARRLRAMYYAQFRAQAQVLKTLSLTNARTGEAWRGMGWVSADADQKIGPEVQNVEFTFGFVVQDSPDGE